MMETRTEVRNQVEQIRNTLDEISGSYFGHPPLIYRHEQEIVKRMIRQARRLLSDLESEPNPPNLQRGKRKRNCPTCDTTLQEKEGAYWCDPCGTFWEEEELDQLAKKEVKE